MWELVRDGFYMKILSSFALLAALLASAPHANEIRIAKIYARKINSANLKESFDSPWGEIGLKLHKLKDGNIDIANRKTDPFDRKDVFSCQELEDALSNGWQKDDSSRGQQESHLLAIHCEAIRRIFTAQPASNSYLDDFLEDSLLLHKLDPVLIAPANDEGCRKAIAARKSGQMWHDVWPHHAVRTSKEDASVRIFDTTQEDWKATSRDESLVAVLTPVAFADFNDDGITDLLIEYRNGYQLGLATLTKRNPSEVITWLDDYCSSP